MNFFRRYQKAFSIIIFIILVGILAYMIFAVFFRSNEPEAPLEEEVISGNGLPIAGPGEGNLTATNSPGSLPSNRPAGGPPEPTEASAVATGGLTSIDALTYSPVLDPTLSPNGDIQYYDDYDGLFYRIDASGNAVKLSDKVFYSVDNVVWAPNKNKAILEYPDGSKILYNFATQKQVTIPSHWEEFSFSPDSGQIIAKSLAIDPENNWLVIANDDGSQATALENIGSNGHLIYPDWSPNNQIVATYTKGMDFNRQSVYFVGKNGENFKSTIIEGRGFQSQWSKSGDRLLYSVYSTDTNLNPKLWIVDAQGETIGQNRRGFDINTWASKCTFSSNTTIYCAVPESLERGSGLVPELAQNTKDNLYKINLQTGLQELIAVPDGVYNISQIIAPENGNHLFFTDAQNSQLYRLDLK